MKEKVMVVSRFEESLDWLSGALENSPLDRVVLYNKGPQQVKSLNPGVSVKDTPNVGREGATFLDYIIENYDSLPDGVWFVQGDPFEHSPDFLGLLSSAVRYADRPVQSLSFRYKEDLDIPPMAVLDANDAFNVDGHRCSHYYLKDMQIAGHCRFHDLGVEFFVREFERKYGTRDCFAYLADRIGIARPRAYTEFAYGACFYARGACLSRHPRWVYERLRDFLFETDDQGGFQVYVLERFWPYLVSGASYETLTDCYRSHFRGKVVGVYDAHERMAHLKRSGDGMVVETDGFSVVLMDSLGFGCVPGLDVEGESTCFFPAESLAEAREKMRSTAEGMKLL